jgi:lipoprotein-anchoring transpeptidase ErfK/SrfK
MHKLIEIDERSQRLVAYEGAKKVFEFDCVLGDKMTPTRHGHFKIARKDRNHVSAEYGRPMTYAMFFDHGRAIHASSHVELRHLAMRAGLDRLDGVLPESKKIASHGCVNLGAEQAAKLFGWAPEGTSVIVR